MTDPWLDEDIYWRSAPSPAISISDAPLIGPPDVPDGTTEIKGIATSLDHKIDEHFAVHAKARWSEAGFHQLGKLLLGGDGFRANEPIALTCFAGRVSA